MAQIWKDLRIFLIMKSWISHPTHPVVVNCGQLGEAETNVSSLRAGREMIKALCLVYPLKFANLVSHFSTSGWEEKPWVILLFALILRERKQHSREIGVPQDIPIFPFSIFCPSNLCNMLLKSALRIQFHLLCRFCKDLQKLLVAQKCNKILNLPSRFSREEGMDWLLIPIESSVPSALLGI